MNHSTTSGENSPKLRSVIATAGCVLYCMYLLVVMCTALCVPVGGGVYCCTGVCPFSGGVFCTVCLSGSVAVYCTVCTW